MKPGHRRHLADFCLCMLVVTIISFCIILPPISANETTGLVLVTDLTGVVGISMENYVSKVLATAKEQNAALIVFELDTPGGLVSSMRAITNSIMDSPVPVLV